MGVNRLTYHLSHPKGVELSKTYVRTKPCKAREGGVPVYVDRDTF